MKLQIGTKVILKSKYGSVEVMENSIIYNRIKTANKIYGVIVGHEINNNPSGDTIVKKLTGYDFLYIISDDIEESGDYYIEEDLEPLKENRKQKLLKILGPQ